jgi:hypothetical protein
MCVEDINSHGSIVDMLSTQAQEDNISWYLKENELQDMPGPLNFK